METIYVDVLIVLNIYVNYFLLRITAKLTHSPLKTGRCIAASFYGSLFSLMILLPELDSLLNIAVKLIAAVTVVAAAFGIKSRKRFIMDTAAFFAANFILAGTVYAVYTWLRPESVHFNNTYFYIDLSLLVLILTTAGLYFGVCIFSIFTGRTPAGEGCYSVFVRYRDKVVSFEGLADTGNSLIDHFTGLPVIVCSSESFGGSGTETGLRKGFRLIPCSTVSGNGIMQVFTPDEVVIADKLSGERKQVDAVIGLGNVDSAVFDPSLLKG